MIFREARLNDVEQLLILEQAVIDAERPFNAAIKQESAYYYNIENLISSKMACLMIVEDEEQIIGSGYAQIRQSKNVLKHEKHAYLGFMYVSPSYRGKNINQKMIEYLMTWSKNQDIFDFYLEVYSQNISALRAYEKVGFQPSLLEMKLHL